MATDLHTTVVPEETGQQLDHDINHYRFSGSLPRSFKSLPETVSDMSYCLARNSQVSANSMPQFPCTAKSRVSTRSIHHSLRRSPRIRSSLSDIIYDYDEITEIPLNTDEKRGLQGASSSQTLVAYQPKRTTGTESVFSFLSAPSKISRTTTQHYVFSPPSLAEMQGEEMIATKRRKTPSQRGICNAMTLAIVIIVILFMFAGYPLALHIAKQMKNKKV
ncbi:hypothetical protein BJV82DRAFT_580248 [Fennellomyces sp. T-0311]|nr:hypothetical protein BJV82DRAFT_580248 [Fennellomyces sp. T-0311]